MNFSWQKRCVHCRLDLVKQFLGFLEETWVVHCYEQYKNWLKRARVYEIIAPETKKELNYISLITVVLKDKYKECIFTENVHIFF